MVFQDVVNTAVKDRTELPSSQRGSLNVIRSSEECYLIIYPFNGKYTEHSIGYFVYYIYHGKVYRKFVGSV